MTTHRSAFRLGLSVLFLGIFLLGQTHAFLPPYQSKAFAAGYPQIEFTPNVTSIQFEAITPAPLISTPMPLDDGLENLSATPIPLPTPQRGTISVEGGVLPLGTDLEGASGLRIIADYQDPYGNYGYGTLYDQPDYVLIWYRTNLGEKHSLILHKNDSLYIGENGYLQNFEKYVSGIEKMYGALGAGVGGLGTALSVGLLACGLQPG